MRKKVIIDCDPGIDDSLAIMLALSCDQIEVLGITIVCGNSPTEMGAGNAAKVLRQMNRLDIPIFTGERTPLKRDYVNALDTHGADGLGESFLEPVENFSFHTDAVSFLEETILNTHCNVIALGPMTNLAKVFSKKPHLIRNVEELVSMGGNFRSHGNCSPVAEYNYWCDPDGASLVYETAARQKRLIHMVGLDVTRQIVLTPDLISYLKRLDSKTGSFVEAITKFYLDFHWEWEHIIGCVINDPLAVAYFIDRSMCDGFDSFTVVATDGVCRGQTVVDSMNFWKKEPNSRILTETDSERFFAFFMERVLRKNDGSRWKKDEFKLLHEL